MEKTTGNNRNLDWEQIGLDWFTMPQTLTFDELITSPIYCKYVDQYGRWKVLLRNGVWYYQDYNDSELGQKCGPLEVVDSVSICYSDERRM